jgi:hemoglobin
MSDEDNTPTPYELLGGDPAIQAIVGRFYDLMDQDPTYAALRRIHGPDLGPMRDKLCDWFSEWLGGPRRYHARTDAKCIGAAHAPYAIDSAMRDEWLACMQRALDEAGASAAAQARIRPAMVGMAEFLRNR